MKNYLSEQEARRAILDVGKRIYDRGYVAANDGNISCKISDTTILVTPTGVSKGFMEPDSLVKMDLGGTILDGGKPSSEVKMHTSFQRWRYSVARIERAERSEFKIILRDSEPLLGEVVATEEEPEAGLTKLA